MNTHQLRGLLKYYLRIREKPLVLQMPITSRCNSRCKTCNVWKHHENIDIDPIALKEVLKDPFFSEVTSVGLNGGEFTLVPAFIDILESVLTLPRIHSIYCISNGLFPKRLFEYLEKAKQKCQTKNVHLHICISVDGYEKIHEEVRGVPKCFNKTREVLDILYNNKDKYCHSFSVGCTLSIHNIEFIKETQAFLESYKGLEIEYHCAIPNKRIKTFEESDYYLLNDDKKRLLAAEFFFEKYLNSKTRQQRYQNFSNFYFLTHGGNERLNYCAYTNRDVTIDENLNLFLCATASDVIGNLKEYSASELIRSKKCKQVQKDILHYCNNCGHYSYHPLTLKGRMKYIKYEMRNRYIWPYYELNRNSLKQLLMENLRFYKHFVKDYLKQIYYLIWKLQ